MTTSIFIKSYGKDFPWLKYCLKSIEKYCTGFSEIVIVVPETDLNEIKSWKLTKEKIIGIYEEDWTDLYLKQQEVKLNADHYCKGDYILYVDSDCCFIRPCCPDDFFVNGKPYMMITPYGPALSRETDAWRKVTEASLKSECKYETMRRIPILYPSFVLFEYRRTMISLHGKTVSDYIKEQPYRAFSEFNSLGSYCFACQNEKFHWIDTVATKETEWPPKFAIQEWSWGGLKPEIQRKFEDILS